MSLQRYVSDDECWRLTPEGGWPENSEEESDDAEHAMTRVTRGFRKKKGGLMGCC